MLIYCVKLDHALNSINYGIPKNECTSLIRTFSAFLGVTTIERYSTDQRKGKRKPLRIRGMDAFNPRMLVCGHADNGSDVRSQLRTRGHPPANPRG